MANLIQIKKYLRGQKLPYRVVDLKGKAFTVGDVVKSGISRDEVVKTLIVRGVKSIKGIESIKGKGFIAIALRGKDRLDFKKVRRLFGSKSELAKPEEVLKVVGVPVGAVCPILISIPIYIDRRAMDLVNVHMGSGDLKFGLEMRLVNLLKTIGEYKVLDFSI